ncbi:sugar phosphate nucleotidyltransferase [Sphingobium sp.]|uniref:sugar phosphate nucleotidyltransferase n=1 Tax=Sphingobium sp. TaxID=1912891 RepID=UPI0025D38A40|nr:sugar phosphate nucleotidyltransferase [Sphingobium sp.]
MDPIAQLNHDSDIRSRPVILAGGLGTRQWSLSCKFYPKQLLPLVGDITLFQAVTPRLSGATEHYAPCRSTGRI